MNNYAFMVFDPLSVDTTAGKNSPKANLTHNCKFILGNANKQLVQRILVFNGVLPSHDSNFFSIYWSQTFPDFFKRSPSLNVRKKYNSESPNFDISPLQKVNHFPDSKKYLGNKAALASTIQNSQHYSKFKPFFPQTFVLPEDRESLFNFMKKNPRQQFIAKPPDGSCGFGIKIVTFDEFYTIKRGYVVSEYISRPLCIDGFKFDMRVYVLVTSFAPLRAFIYKEGLARFATESYSTHTKEAFSHLTNATLNKKSKKWTNDFKWKLSELLAEIQLRYNRSEEEIMEKIINVVSITLALVQPVMSPKTRNYPIDPFFELYGFDLLLDVNFDIWLLEINTNPSLGYDSDVDYQVKVPLIAQTLSIVGITDMDPAQLPKTIKVDDIDAFDEEIIENEDDRNEMSGNGFIRIFPSIRSKLFKNLLYTSKFSTKITKEKLSPITLGKSLTQQQSSLVLLRYLAKMEQKLRNGELQTKSISKLQNYLINRGFEIERVRKNTRTVLHNYIIQQRLLISSKSKEIPDKLEKIIDSKNEIFLAEMLINSPFYILYDCKSLF
ncbi:Tubulin-tyrosine ligase family protein [Tritrichomonas foetus]|uniref:Tubulin-tyrosine ligase family protein n=1 Tax=Tritrichomonas foetus TaxID=1144522 RepID=A0A1J4KNZ7_9EUKA|nr:Tubulin-tyrosine ligase family protein [Tritrichomonas foetus]|eukprot:OHT12648.1 Tubulin-tyrosine ligase family protein [Tritrichomonas foetus]